MARRLGVQELETLCNAFLGLSGMRDQNTRELYVSTLNSELGNSLTFPRYLDPFHDVWSLLEACQDHLDGIRELASVVRRFHRRSRPMNELDELVECLLPDEILNHAERAELLDLLADVETRALGLACRHASPTSWLATEIDLTATADIVRRFESCLTSPGSPPQLLAFVDFVAHQSDAIRSAEQHRWIDKMGISLNLPSNRLRDLCVATVARLDEGQRFYFIVQLEPDGVDPDGYLMSVWLQHHRSVEEPLHRDDVPLTLPEIIDRLPDLLGRAHAALGVDLDDMTVEFILPRSLIGHPVDQWEIDHVFPHRIGTSYPVVVRSLDRLRKPEMYGAWRYKWRWLAANGHRDEPDAIHWLADPGARAPSSLHASLRRDQSSVALAMAYPPADSSELMTDELTAALYAGVPVVFWCRNALVGEQFEQKIRTVLTSHGLSELPAQIMRLRQDADEVEEATDTPLGRHLTLLWDDADRVPQAFRTPRLQAPQ